MNVKFRYINISDKGLYLFGVFFNAIEKHYKTMAEQRNRRRKKSDVFAHRVCYMCKSDKTSLQNGETPLWYKNKDIEGTWLCRGCMMSRIHKGKLQNVEWVCKRTEHMNGKSNPMYGRKGELHPKYGKGLIGEKNPMYGKKHSEKTRELLREARRNHILPYKDSSIEVKIQEYLREVLNIKFEKHVPIIGQPDIVIGKLVIFCDGDYWHANPKFYDEDDFIFKNVKAKDRWARDYKISNELKTLGYVVLRLWEDDINNNFDYCKQLIRDHIERFI